jgi:hypothetical protein
MVDWLHKLLQKPVLTVASLLILFVIIAWLFLGAVSVLSDIGFSSEITEYRWWIASAAASAGVLGVLFYVYWYLQNQVRTLRVQLENLRTEKQDLNEQKESAFRLMKRYKTEAQEDIFKRLQELALSSILQSEWKNKEARVERFRVEKSLPGNKDLHMADSLDRVTIFINLGSTDSVTVGMRFFVQDPTDLKKYGTIVINECHENGSSCSILEIEHPAFWVEVMEALKSQEDSPIINASPNVLVPTSPYRELSLESATELLDWLIKLEPVADL